MDFFLLRKFFWRMCDECNSGSRHEAYHLLLFCLIPPMWRPIMGLTGRWKHMCKKIQPPQSFLISFLLLTLEFFFLCFRAGHIVFSAKSESGAGQEKKKRFCRRHCSPHANNCLDSESHSLCLMPWFGRPSKAFIPEWFPWASFWLPGCLPTPCGLPSTTATTDVCVSVCMYSISLRAQALYTPYKPSLLHTVYYFKMQNRLV